MDAGSFYKFKGGDWINTRKNYAQSHIPRDNKHTKAQKAHLDYLKSNKKKLNIEEETHHDEDNESQNDENIKEKFDSSHTRKYI